MVKLLVKRKTSSASTASPSSYSSRSILESPRKRKETFGSELELSLASNVSIVTPPHSPKPRLSQRKGNTALNRDVSDIKKQLKNSNKLVRAVLGEQGTLDRKSTRRAIRQFALVRNKYHLLKKQLSTSQRQQHELSKQWTQVCLDRNQQKVRIEALKEEVRMCRLAVLRSEEETRTLQENAKKVAFKQELHSDKRTGKRERKLECKLQCLQDLVEKQQREMRQMQEELANLEKSRIERHSDVDSCPDIENLKRQLEIAKVEIDELEYERQVNLTEIGELSKQLSGRNAGLACRCCSQGMEEHLQEWEQIFHQNQKRIKKLEQERLEYVSKIEELQRQPQESRAYEHYGAFHTDQADAMSDSVDSSVAPMPAAPAVSPCSSRGESCDVFYVNELERIMEQNQFLTRQLETEKQTVLVKMKVLTEMLEKSSFVVENLICELETTRARERSLRAETAKLRMELDPSRTSCEIETEEYGVAEHGSFEGDREETSSYILQPDHDLNAVGWTNEDCSIDRLSFNVIASASDADGIIMSRDIGEHGDPRVLQYECHGSDIDQKQQQEFQMLLDEVVELRSELQRTQVMMVNLELDRNFYITKVSELNQLFCIDTADQAMQKLLEKSLQCAHLRTQVKTLSTELEETKEVKERLEQERESNMAKVTELSQIWEIQAKSKEVELNLQASLVKVTDFLDTSQKRVEELERDQQLTVAKATDLSIELANSRAAIDDLTEQLENERRTSLDNANALNARKDTLSRRIRDEQGDDSTQSEQESELGEDSLAHHNVPELIAEEHIKNAGRRGKSWMKFSSFRRNSKKEVVTGPSENDWQAKTVSYPNVDNMKDEGHGTQTDPLPTSHVEWLFAEGAPGRQPLDAYDDDEAMVDVDITAIRDDFTPVQAQELTILSLMKKVETLEEEKADFSMNMASLKSKLKQVKHETTSKPIKTMEKLEPEFKESQPPIVFSPTGLFEFEGDEKTGEDSDILW